MRNKQGNTPKEEAVGMVIDYIYAIVKKRVHYDHLEQLGKISSPKFVEETERHLRAIHNRVQDMCASFDEEGYI